MRLALTLGSALAVGMGPAAIVFAHPVAAAASAWMVPFAAIVAFAAPAAAGLVIGRVIRRRHVRI